MSLQEITQGVTRVHTNVKKKQERLSNKSPILYTINMEDSVYCIEMYEAFFFGGYQYYLFTLPTPSLFMFKLYKFHVQIRIDLKER